MRRQANIDDLRAAIACLPRTTRIAMLQGIATNPIIVGAYTSRDGICPMLAAHRNGGRTSLIAFAEAWDRVAFRGQRRPQARRASERELLILRAHLEASLLEDEGPGEALAAARRAHEELVAARRAAEEPARRRASRPAATCRRCQSPVSRRALARNACARCRTWPQSAGRSGLARLARRLVPFPPAPDLDD